MIDAVRRIRRPWRESGQDHRHAQTQRLPGEEKRGVEQFSLGLSQKSVMPYRWKKLGVRGY